MILNINGKEYDIKTNIGAMKRIENRAKRPLSEVLARLPEATIDELITLLKVAESVQNSDIAESIEEAWDYTDLEINTQKVLLQMMFSGTPDQQEAKIDKYPVGEDEKNAIRRALGLPIKALQSPTSDGGNASFAQPLD